MSEGVELVQNSNIKGVQISDSSMQNDKGVITAKTSPDFKDFAKSFVEAISQHRFWMREQKDKVPA